MKMPTGEIPSSRSDIQILFTGLPEPIDLELDADAGRLFWTDRGDPPMGNTINAIDLADLKFVSKKNENPKFDILARNMHEAIGIKLDSRNKHIYASDIGGVIYRFDMDGKNKTKVYDSDEGAFSGITLAYI